MDMLTHDQTKMLILMLNEVSIEHTINSMAEIHNEDGSFTIRFEGTVNPFGYFVVVPYQLLDAVIRACEQNLRSDMHRYAKLYRRIQPRIGLNLRKARSKHDKMVREIVDRYRTMASTLPKYSPQRMVLMQDRDNALEPVHQKLQRREEWVYRRVKCIHDKAVPGLADKHYSRYVESLEERVQSAKIL